MAIIKRRILNPLADKFDIKQDVARSMVFEFMFESEEDDRALLLAECKEIMSIQRLPYGDRAVVTARMTRIMADISNKFIQNPSADNWNLQEAVALAYQHIVKNVTNAE